MAPHFKTHSAEQLYAEVGQYYTAKLHRWGPTPLGVDWSCVPTQEMRFVQLMKLVKFDQAVSLNDLGCGYGALVPFLARRHRGKSIDYLGIDLSVEMIVEARRLWGRRRWVAFAGGSSCTRTADYSVASGIFNVKLAQSGRAWTDFIASTLSDMHAHSRLGFAVNFLAPLSEGVPDIPQLYRVQQHTWADYCTKNLGADVEVLSGYGMREFTLLVRRRLG